MRSFYLGQNVTKTSPRVQRKTRKRSVYGHSCGGGEENRTPMCMFPQKQNVREIRLFQTFSFYLSVRKRHFVTISVTKTSPRMVGLFRFREGQVDDLRSLLCITVYDVTISAEGIHRDRVTDDVLDRLLRHYTLHHRDERVTE